VDATSTCAYQVIDNLRKDKSCIICYVRACIQGDVSDTARIQGVLPSHSLLLLACRASKK
jgi:hypothetical protein